jgi:hypothetical protein
VPFVCDEHASMKEEKLDDKWWLWLLCLLFSVIQTRKCYQSSWARKQ